MRLLRFGFLAVVSVLSVPLAAQSPPQRDPQAVAVAARAFTALGGPAASAGFIDFELRGTTTFAGVSDTPMQVVIRGRGTGSLRVEVQLPKGLNVLILRDGQGAIQRTDGSVRRLELYNTIGPRNFYIPAFSFLARYNESNVEVQSREGELVRGTPADVVEFDLSEHDSGPAPIVRDVTKQRFFFDRVSGLPLKVEYDNLAENDSNAKTKTEIYYSDYRLVRGTLVPFRQDTYADGELQSTLILTSVQFNLGLSDSEFTLRQ